MLAWVDQAWTDLGARLSLDPVGTNTVEVFTIFDTASMVLTGIRSAQLVCASLSDISFWTSTSEIVFFLSTNSIVLAWVRRAMTCSFTRCSGPFIGTITDVVIWRFGLHTLATILAGVGVAVVDVFTGLSVEFVFAHTEGSFSIMGTFTTIHTGIWFARIRYFAMLSRELETTVTFVVRPFMSHHASSAVLARVVVAEVHLGAFLSHELHRTNTIVMVDLRWNIHSTILARIHDFT